MMAAQMMERDSDQHHPPEWARVPFISRKRTVLRVLVTDDLA
jgi:hypothetical protein